MQLTRTRAFAAFTAGIAVTAASAITLDAVIVDAVDQGESTFVPVTPCRLFDTRSGADNVGRRSTPLGAAASDTFQVAGSNGNCTIPDDATAVAMNVTTTDMTASSFLTVWPAGETRPLASSLNYESGQSPTPNKVDVKLGTGGAIDIYNHAGTTNVLADIVGYYTDTGLQRLRQDMARTIDTPRLRFSEFVANPVDLPDQFDSISGVGLYTPADGYIVVTASANLFSAGDGTLVSCRITSSDHPLRPGEEALWRSARANDLGHIFVQRVVEVEGPAQPYFELQCRDGNPAVAGSVANPQVVASFISYDQW